MGEETLSPPTHPTPSFPSADAASIAAEFTDTATSKIPFRPRKIRKLSSSSASADDSHKKKAAIRVFPRPLSAAGEIDAALHHIRAVDPLLANVIDAHDPPTFQCLVSPFHSLVRSILYQQLAVKAAASIYGRFLSLCGGDESVVPDVVLSLTCHQLRQIGVSKRKASYLHDLAGKYNRGILSDASIVAMDDKSLFSMLTMVKGIGAWSVHMFMMFCLHRPDVLPVGDLGVRKGVQMLYSLDDVPRPSQMEQLCERWKPYRSVGSWYMWRLVEAKRNYNLASSASGGPRADDVGVGNAQQEMLPRPQRMTDSFQILQQSWVNSVTPSGCLVNLWPA